MGLDSSKALVSPKKDIETPTLWLECYTAKELMAQSFPTPTWVVEDILPAGLTLVVGKPKFGKSIFALNLSLDVAMGNRALGKYPTYKGTVLYLALEDTPRRLQDRMRLMLNGQEPPDNLYLFPEWPRFNEKGAQALECFLSEHPETNLVIIDTFIRFRPNREVNKESYSSDYNDVQVIKAIADQHSLAIVLIHHVRKMPADDPIDEVLGTTGLTGAADTIIVCRRNRNESNGTLQLIGRDVEEDEMIIQFKADQLYWEMVDNPLLLSLTPEREKIIDILRSISGHMSPAEIAAALGHADSNKVRQLLKKMKRDGIVSCPAWGVYVLHDPHNDVINDNTPI